MKNLVLTPLIALLASGGGALVAQDFTTAVLAGRVTSQDGAPLRGVNVLIQSPALLQSRQATTDASGQFRALLLPNGEYTVTYTLNGYLTRRLSLRIVAGQTINGSITLTSITTQEATVEISTTNTIAQVDKTDTVVQTSFSADYLRQLKTLNDLWSIGQLVPGVNNNNATSFRVRGGSQGGVKILTDGQSSMEASGGYFGSTALVPQDLIESVAVLQSPTNARYGNSDGGLVSMVTSKGTNTFRGTFRITGLRRGFWGVTDRGYPTREGLLNSVPNASNDNLSRNYEYTIQGPIWKDHITFAYAGKITPPSESSNSWNRGQWTDRTRGPQPQDQVGLYYRDSNGLVIRRSELGGLQDPFGVFGSKRISVYNHFSVYAQVTPNHQLEYSYRDTNAITSPRSPLNGSNSREILPADSDEEPSRFWTMAYKGIIGSSGLLEIRHGYNLTGWVQPGVGMRAHRVYTIPSVVPISGTYDTTSNWIINNYSNNDPSNFRASGYVDVALNTNGEYRTHTFGGRDDTGAGAAGGTASTTINYQHNLTTAMGSHLIDLGVQNDKFDWRHTLNVAEQFYVPGQLPFSLTPQDFYNPNNVPINLSNYAGRFIVFNVGGATLGDLDLYGLNRYIANNPTTPLRPDTRLYQDSVVLGGDPNATRLANFFPRVFRRFGEGSDKFYTQMRSFYVNDQWTINDYHSVMLGVRFDNWKLWDRVKEFHSYTKPTLRFDYKWDIHGDQSRLVSASFAQYHNNNYNAIFSRFASRPQTDSETRYWNKPGPNGLNGPYLVGYDELTDLKNYGILVSSAREAADTSQIDPNWKAPTTNELSVSFARNLSNGGSWKISFVKRIWSDLYDLFPGDVFTNNSGQNQSKMLLKNTDVWERTYTGVEVEWNAPVTKRLTFAGNYTYGRLMSNESGTADGTNMIHSSGGDLTFNVFSEFFDGFWPRELWAPVTQKQSDHSFKFQLIQDLSLGNLKSTVALQGGWTSAGYGTRSFWHYTGRPIVPGVNEYNWGGVGQNTTNLPYGKYIPINLVTGADSWYTNLRYNLDMPLVRKLVWFTTVDISNPFNHRGKQFSAIGTGPGASHYIYETDMISVNADGTTRVVYPKNGPLGPYNGIWRSDGNVNGSYRDYMGGRSVTVQTGLRF